MTWHAVSYLLVQVVLLGIGAAAFYFFWMVPHRGRHWLRRLHIRSELRIIVGLVVIAAAGFLFVHILLNVLQDRKLAQADLRLHNTLRLFHSDRLHWFYSGISRVASTSFVVPFVVVLVVIFWTAHRRREAVAVVVAYLLEVLLSVILKYTIHRPRPPDAILLHLGPSFPSGHTLNATVVYGFLAYLLLRDDDRRRWWHVVAAVPLLAIVILTPISRVYLGVHWPYDTIASLALGLAVLAIVITLFKYPPVEHEFIETDPSRAPWFDRAIWIYAAVAVIAAFLFATRELPEVRPPAPPVIGAVSTEALSSFPAQLQKTSEDLIGGPMEPVSFLFVGSSTQVTNAFERAGWFLADIPSVRGLTHELIAVIRDEPDPHGPATPAYYGAEPQDLTFERPGTASGSIRHRHHIRIWRAPLEAGNQFMWVATCSYDAGVEFVPKPYLITHRIDPNVDREREMIRQQLEGAGARELATVAVTGPRSGHNAGGDNFFTDGHAHVLMIP